MGVEEEELSLSGFSAKTRVDSPYHRRRPRAGAGRQRNGARAFSCSSWWLTNPALRVLSRRSACRHQASARPRSARSTPRTTQVRNGPSRRHGSIASSATAATTRARSGVAGISPRAASCAALRSRSGQ